MSTGAECRIYEKTKGKWYYDLQCYPYGETDQYDTFGPFSHYAAAIQHLDKHHANPGGHSIDALPGCPHDMTRKPDMWMSGDDEHLLECDRCGGSVTTLDYEPWKAQVVACLVQYGDVLIQLGADAEPLMQAQFAERTPPGSAGLFLVNESYKIRRSRRA
jgi:hypothetical protein